MNSTKPKLAATTAQPTLVIVSTIGQAASASVPSNATVHLSAKSGTDTLLVAADAEHPICARVWNTSTRESANVNANQFAVPLVWSRALQPVCVWERTPLLIKQSMLMYQLEFLDVPPFIFEFFILYNDNHVKKRTLQDQYYGWSSPPYNLVKTLIINVHFLVSST